jgi:acyl-CoA thioester hydrolase
VTRLHIPVGVRWSDLDAYGHVNNVQVLRLLEEARVQAFWIADHEEERGSSPSSAVIESKLGSDTLSIVSHTEIEYLTTIEYRRSPLDIQVWVSRLGGADLEVCYEIRTPVAVVPEVLYAKATTTIVLVDPASMRPRRMRENEREAWKPYLGEAITFKRR